MRKPIIIVFILIIAALGLSFATLNADDVVVDFFFGEADLPLSFVLVVTLILGALLGVLASQVVVFRKRREIRKLKREVSNAQKELNELRRLPLKEGR